MENHHFQWTNPLFQWPCSIVMLLYRRLNPIQTPTQPPFSPWFSEGFPMVFPSRGHHRTTITVLPVLAGRRPAAAPVPRSSPAPRPCDPGRRSPRASRSPGRGKGGRWTWKRIHHPQRYGWYMDSNMGSIWIVIWIVYG